ncbi:MAG: heme d1 biosynthesis radical SAM protein NirJ [Rhodospirillaceae bacterium]
MMRLTRLLREPAPGDAQPATMAAARGAPAPVVIWNLLRRCNLSCRFCYTGSADARFPGELETIEILRGLEDLRGFGVGTLVLSGGEPLLHPDLAQIAGHAKALGFFVSLSTNGTLIDEAAAAVIAATGYDHVGISLDGLAVTHDRVRGRTGAFDASLRGLRLCRDAGLSVGVRFTFTRDTEADLPALLALSADEGISRFYLSHLNYAGRGGSRRVADAWHATTRSAMESLFETTLADLAAGRRREIVTGNNDADGVFLLHWLRRHHPDRAAAVERRLRRWGGNATGIGIANIDSRGQVHPDTMMAFVSLGSIRQRRFSEIWADDDSHPVLAGLRQRPRPVTGRCAGCVYSEICNGNTRTRAYSASGDPWAEDPGCYLTEAEIAPAGPP